MIPSLSNILHSLLFVVSFCEATHGTDIHHVPYGKDVFGDFDWNAVKPSRSLKYHNCYDGLRCARFEVPLDWSNASNPNSVILAIGILPAKVKSTDPRYGGTIFIQPGGPGGSGLDLLRNQGRGMQAIVDSDTSFDLLAWDPRGVKFTTPSVACFKDDLDRQLYSLKSAAVGYIDSSKQALNTHWAAAAGFANLCGRSTIGIYEDGSNIRQFVSTALVARDMVAIVDALDESHRRQFPTSRGSQQLLVSKTPALIQYWGYSYGTYLGNTFASMFPQRIGRMILDGVVDAPDYAATGWTSNLQDTHKGLLQILRDCFDGKELCPLYDKSVKAVKDLGSKVTKFLVWLREHPMPIVHNGTVDLVTISDVRYRIFDYLYEPLEHYPWLGQMLADLMAGNASLLIPELPRIKLPQTPTGLSIGKGYVPPPVKRPQSGYQHSIEASPTILCGDGDPLEASKPKFEEYLALLQEQEPLAAGYWASIKLPCVFWPANIRPAEHNRFTGPFASKQSDYSPGSSPVLWIGNTADPVTPVRNAHRMAAEHEGSVVLTQDMPGHCAGPWKPSECTWKHIKQFFANGTLPETGTVCAGDRRPWDGKGPVGDQDEWKGNAIDQGSWQYSERPIQRGHAYTAV